MMKNMRLIKPRNLIVKTFILNQSNLTSCYPLSKQKWLAEAQQ